MYSKQLLIKIDDETINQLKNFAQRFGLSVSSFARMVLKRFIARQSLNEEDQMDIKFFEEQRGEKGDDFDLFLQQLNNEN